MGHMVKEGKGEGKGNSPLEGVEGGGEEPLFALESLYLTTLSLVPLKRVPLGMAQLAWSSGKTLLAFLEAAAGIV